MPTRTPTQQELIAHGNIPRHVAIIMDGNGRWAKARGVPRIMGHRAGRESVREAVRACSDLGVQVLTLYTFSVENWQRPAREVNALMTILRQSLRAERKELDANNVRLNVVGRVHELPSAVREEIAATQKYLSNNTGMLMNLALSYSGRAEIVDGVKRMLKDAKEGAFDPARVDDELFASYLYTAGLPDPDLLIRTSGEMRISNFLLWQLAYTELWITDTLWPDFRRENLHRAIADYQRRDRRFGRTD
ncbi:MAG: isoprenyl transferase [Candidatus Eisenbacteria bacterium]|uniref:Isoprenyl transferase n=1 Tax=Eiseniibacteriota bacterium TaxID=2212470 RepID=A0A933SCQ9_UNCEI|nr:isoprenyl transferase [Candidatus Eisenbacteria bacterium]